MLCWNETVMLLQLGCGMGMVAAAVVAHTPGCLRMCRVCGCCPTEPARLRAVQSTGVWDNSSRRCQLSGRPLPAAGPSAQLVPAKLLLLREAAQAAPGLRGHGGGGARGTWPPREELQTPAKLPAAAEGPPGEAGGAPRGAEAAAPVAPRARGTLGRGGVGGGGPRRRALTLCAPQTGRRTARTRRSWR